MKIVTTVLWISLPALVAAVGSGLGALLLVWLGDLTITGGWIMFYLTTALGVAASGYVAFVLMRRRE